MFLEMTTGEAELLIAVLTFAEGAALDVQPSLSAAIEDLRPLRSLLMKNYLYARMAQIEVTEKAR